MNDKTQVIVLSQMDYKENDALVKVFSYDYGLMTFLARGIRKINSKNRSICMPYTLSEFMFNYNEQRGLQNLLQGQIIESNHKIHDDLDKSSVASVLAELMENLIKEELDPDVLHDYFEFTRSILNQIQSRTTQKSILAYVLSTYMRHYGITPEVDACVICGSSKINSISIDHGGFICHDCQMQIHSPIYTPEFLKDFRLSQKINMDNFMQYLEYKDVDTELIAVLVKFLEFHTGQSLKSWEFLLKWSIMM